MDASEIFLEEDCTVREGMDHLAKLVDGLIDIVKTQTETIISMTSTLEAYDSAIKELQAIVISM